MWHQVVRAGAADDAVRIEAEAGGDRVAQVRGAAIWVTVEIPSYGLQGAQRARRWPIGAFVRG